ncbi:hypothetical protein HDU83_005884 [Entophlyctis luteolus]|nr:hypothetical protein HDU83_005884 [Entophlyctis luteolus]
MTRTADPSVKLTSVPALAAVTAASLALLLLVVLRGLPNSSPHRRPHFEDSALASPHVSLQAFMNASDYYYGYDFRDHPHLTPLNASTDIAKSALHRPAIVFVAAWEMPVFAQTILPLLNAPFVLITADTATDIPYGVFTPDETAALIAGTSNMKHWFTTNCDRGALVHSDRISCIPIGLNSYTSSPDTLRELSLHGFGVHKHGKRLPNTVKPTKNSLLVSFNTFTNPVVREPLMNSFCGEATSSSDGVKSIRSRNVANCFLDNKLTLAQFYRNVLEPARFVLAPGGNARDTYRVWESLIAGAIPIVDDAVFNQNGLYRDLPVLVINKWDDLSADFLERAYADFASREWEFAKLFVGYWIDKMRTYA